MKRTLDHREKENFDAACFTTVFWVVEKLCAVQAHLRLDETLQPQAHHSMCLCLRRESMRVMNNTLKIAHLNHFLV